MTGKGESTRRKVYSGILLRLRNIFIVFVTFKKKEKKDGKNEKDRKDR